ncbi:lysophospholipase L1-like esterase [Pedobacter sp. CG_S7]|uniref:SGNH/GDSL hydrolase family protein n=1 Tax=Pedobacter sp. CG_S7 TaxID=3143930 RepID=UPI003395C5B5
MRKYVFLLITVLIFASADAQLSSKGYVCNFGDLNNSFNLIKQRKAITIAFLGGSITHMEGWRGLVGQFLTHKYPEVNFKFINAGIPSLGSLPHAFRLKQDVLEQGKIDLMFLESAVNDRANGTSEKIQRRALEGIIRHSLQENPDMDLVMMAFADPEKLKDYRDGNMPVEVKVHEDVAQHYKLPFLNLAKEVADRINAGEFTWEKDFKNLHPSPFGQLLYANTISNLLLQNDSLSLKKIRPKHYPSSLEHRNYNNGNYLSIENVEVSTGFISKANWVPSDQANTRQGFVAIPVLEGLKPGASFVLHFKGSVIGIATLAGPDAGILEYSIDGKAFPAIDLFTQWSKNLHLPWYKMLADELDEGNHKLELIILNKNNSLSKGHAIRILNFLVN